MQEKLKRSANDNLVPEDKSVTLSIRSRTIVLNGSWSWDMHSDTVFCSDVMAFPPGFEGTKGIIHPDDLARVTKALEVMQGMEISRLDFRLITTYGEIKNITGQQISLAGPVAAEAEPEWEEAAREAVLREIKTRKEAALLRLRTSLSEASESLHGIGIWYTNKSTGETWYSDAVFRIHGIPPQGLNAHAHTFSAYIHADDRVAVLEAFEQAYTGELPLHMEYRIVQPGGKVRFVRQVTNWSFDEKGHRIFSGTLHDITEIKELSTALDVAEANVQLHQQVVQYAEKQASVGYWFMNLVTRKTTFSPNYIRIHGVKTLFSVSHQTFLDLVHPEDKEKVQHLIERVYKEHVLPEVTYRIIRPDGKQRYLRLSGKLSVIENSELVMMGVVHDITTQKNGEKAIQDLNDTLTLQNTATATMEQLALVSSVIWFPNGHMHWSDGFYQLLGYKPHSVEPLHSVWQKSVHPGDLKAFTDTITLALNQQAVEDLFFRIISKKGIRQLRLSIRQVAHQGRGAVVGVVQDITAQVSLQQQAGNKTRYISLLESVSQDAILLTNAENTIISWNAAAEEKTGIKKDDALNQNLFDLFPVLHTEGYLIQLQAALAGREQTESKVRNRYLGKAHSYHLFPVTDEQGAVQGVLHVVRDIAKELELQQQLNERLNFIENLLNATVDRIVVLDQHMNYLYWNPKAEEYYALSKERVLGKNILEVFPAFRNDPTYQEFRRALKGETVHLPATLTEPGGAYFETYLIPVKEEDGIVTGVLWIVHDLSSEYQLRQEHLKANKRLQEEQQRFKEAQAIGRVGSFDWNAETDVISWSDEMYHIHGLEPQSETLTMERVLSFIDKNHLPEFINSVQQCRREPSSCDFVHQIIRADGAVRIVQRRLRSFADESGKVTHFSGTLQDITEQVEARRQLEASETLLRTAETVAQTGSYEVELSTMSIRFSDGMFRLFGEEPGSFTPSLEWIDARTHPDDGPVIKAVLEQAATDKKPYYYLRRIYRKDGAMRLVETHGRVICDTAGNAAGYVGVVQDITERRKSEETIQQMLNGAISAITILDAVRDESGKIVDFVFRGCNKAAEEINRLSREEMLGKGLLELFPGVKDVFFDTYVQVVETGESLRVQRYYPHEHYHHWFDVSAVKNGDGFIMTFHDITEQKKAEQELLQTKELLARRATERYQNVINSMDEGFCVVDLIFDGENRCIDYRFADMNPVFERQTGLQNALDKTIREALPGTEPMCIDHYSKVARTGEPARFEIYMPLTGKWFNVYAFPIDRHAEQRVAVFFNDITERKKAEERQAFLLQLSDTLRPMTEPGAIREAAMQLLGQHLGVNRAYYAEALEEGDTLVTGPGYFNGVPSLAGYLNISGLDPALREMYLAGRTLVLPDLLEDVTLRGGVAAADETTQIRAVVEVPLVKNGKLVALVGVHQTTPRKWAAEEVGLIEEVGERTWAALERAKAESQLAAFAASLEEQVAERTASLKKTAEELQKNLAILQHAESLAQMGSWEYELASGAFNWSEGMYNIFGLPQRAKVRPETYLDFAVEEDRSTAKQIIKNLKKGHQSFEETMRIKKGTESRLLKIKGSVVPDEEGKAQKVVGVDVDITDIKEAEQRLEESRHWLAQTAEASPDAITVYDLANKLPVYLNNCLAQWLGTTTDELVRMGVGGRLKLVHSDDRLRLLHFNEKVKNAKDGAVLTLEYRLHGKDDHLMWIRNRSKVFQRDASGEVTHILSVLQDITEEKAAEEVLKNLNATLQKKNAELESKNDEITSFAFVASHDLKEPIRKIHTFTDMLMNKESDRLSDNGRDLLHRMGVSVKRLDLLINDILELSRIHAESARFEMVDLGAVLQKVLAELQEPIIHAGAVIHAGELPVIRAIGSQVFYLFKNLISNALKFQVPGNVPQIEIQAAEVDGARLQHPKASGKFLKVEVKDNGIGFDQKYKEKIFRIFQRLHVQEAFPGTGMGLAICRKVMENHGGFIDVDSQVGSGTTFCCYFPILGSGHTERLA